jgi:hypothetical protein
MVPLQADTNNIKIVIIDKYFVKNVIVNCYIK